MRKLHGELVAVEERIRRLGGVPGESPATSRPPAMPTRSPLAAGEDVDGRAARPRARLGDRDRGVGPTSPPSTARTSTRPAPASPTPANPPRRGRVKVRDERFAEYFMSSSFHALEPARPKRGVKRNQRIFAAIALLTLGFWFLNLLYG